MRQPGTRRRPRRDAAGMHSYYTYEPAIGLYALTLTGADGEQYVVVMDAEEFDELADWVRASPWRATPIGLDSAAMRALLLRVINRDPYD